MCHELGFVVLFFTRKCMVYQWLIEQMLCKTCTELSKMASPIAVYYLVIEKKKIFEDLSATAS